ncbi:MAG: AAC(3) family N-acetyltransferase [Alphaproteobacteria bacterium]|nr:MAG: AAC(3) family N-acetyltransferase [Alphaproteobacteria bacterium]
MSRVAKNLGLLRKKLFPRGVTERVRDLRRSMERRVHSRKIDASEFREALLGLGEWKSRPVFVQSSWNDFYNVAMRPSEIIDMMLDLVGQHGTLLMPAFPLRNDPSVELAIDTAPVNTGLISEMFRRMPGAKRSIHLRSSVAALGPDAEALTADHHLTEYSWGPNSPYGRLYETNGLMVGLGIVPLGFTPLHYVECVLHHEVPFFENKVFDGSTVSYRWKRKTGERGEHTFLDRKGRIWAGRLRKYFPSEIYTEFPVSNLKISSAPAREAVDIAIALARINKTVYFEPPGHF